MTTLETLTLITAIWGAATGTIAVLIQLMEQYSDRGKPVVRASMSQTVDIANPIARLVVEIQVLNSGKRPILIEHVGILLPNAKKDDPNVRKVRTIGTFFDAEASNGIHQLGEGEKRAYRLDPFPPEWGRLLWSEGKTAQAFARLTTGKEYFATFYLIDPANFPKQTGPAAG